MASNIPKFTSFRPKPKAVPEPPKDTSTPEPTPAVTKGSKTKTKTLSDRTEARASEQPNHERGASSSKVYFSDRRGDPEVLRYGTLNSSEIPAYRRTGYGCVLGLGPHQKIDREHSSQTKIYIIPATGKRQERLLTSKQAVSHDGRTLRFIHSANTQASEEVLDFIPVSTSHKRKRSVSEEEAEEDGELDYRGITRDSTQPKDPDTQYEPEIEDFTAGSGITKKNTELVRKTREFPEDMQPWVDFIEHQEAMLLIDNPSAALTDAAKRQLADVRIPLYEEALKKVRHVLDNHIRLHIGLLREAQKSWNEAKLISRWREVLQKHPGNAQLWLMFLDFKQSSFTGFKYESCRTTFLECLEALRAVSKDGNLEARLHGFIRTTSMIQAAGYQELAVAIWQAVLERSHGQPTPGATPQDDLEYFEGFWETEDPRIGEIGAGGWREVLPDDGTSSVMAPLLSKAPADFVFEDFRKRETDSIEKMRYPGRTSDDIGEDDAFHTVFFVDIEEYLKLWPTDASMTLVIEAFLCFCGLPPLPQIADHQRAWWTDPFLSYVSARSKLPEYPDSTERNPLVQRFERYASCYPRSVQMTSDLLFEQDFTLEGVRLSVDFVRRVLKLITASADSDDVLGEYLLAFELQHFPSDVFKTAKQLLKSQPTNQRLYHAYGLVESRRGKSDKANHVFSMALSMGSVGSYESLKLLNSWVWEALRNGNQMEALWRLTSPSGKLPARSDPLQQPDPTNLSIASTSLGEACEKALLRQDYPSAVIGTSLLALKDYLSNDNPADVALAAHQRLLDWFSSNKLSTSPYAELNAQAIARFLIYHVTHTAIVKPALVRSAMEPLITLFPNNTILLSLYAANEARFAIDDRVRSIMQQTALQSSQITSVAGWSFALNFETMRGEIAGSTSHSIRALYKRAINTGSSGAHSPILWTAYLRFEFAQLELERAKCIQKKPGKDGKKRTWESRLDDAETRVKETFYQGLRRLPWCKDFMMLALTEAHSVFSEEEMWKVYRVMQEKELRVYVELE
jgi:hypothetical protein